MKAINRLGYFSLLLPALVALPSCNQAESTKSEDPELRQENTSHTVMNSKEGHLSMKTLHDFEAQTLRGENFDFEKLEGQRVLIVNTASECGFTPQYEKLQKLYEEFGGEHFTIIGFPSNDFGGQEPGSDAEIQEFCKQNYGVTFPMMSKTPVTGDKAHSVYQWLSKEDLNGVADASVSWNFNKFLVDAQGNWIAHYPSQVSPLDDRIKDFARGEEE